MCYELKKLLHYKLFWILLAFFLMLSFIVCYNSAEKDPQYPYLAIVSKAHTEDPEALLRYYGELSVLQNDYEMLYIAWEKGQLASEPENFVPFNFSGNPDCNDFILLQRFYASVNIDAEYKAHLENLIAECEQMQTELKASYTNVTEESYAYRKQEIKKTLYRTVLDDAELRVEIGYGWEHLMNYDGMNLFLLCSVLLAAAFIIQSDTDVSLQLLRTLKKGRVYVILSKIGTALFLSVGITVLYMLSSILAIWLKCGAFSDVTNSIAIFPDYRNVPFAFTILDYLLILTVARSFVLFTVMLFVFWISLISRSTVIGISGGLLLCGAEYVLSLIRGDSILKLCNLFSFMCFHPVIQNFKCFAVSEIVVMYVVAALILILTCIFVVAILAVICFVTMRFSSRKRFSWLPVCVMRIEVLLEGLKKWKHRRSVCKARCGIFYELYKVFWRWDVVVLLLCIVIFSGAVISERFTYTKGYSDGVYMTYMETLEGVPTEEKLQYLEEEVASIYETEDKYADMRTAYYGGVISKEEYAEFLAHYEYAEAHRDVAVYLLSHAEYLKEQQATKGIVAEYLYDADWKTLFMAEENILLIVLIIYLSSGVLADEYRQRENSAAIISLVRSAKRGRAVLFRYKVIVALVIGFASALLFCVADLYYMMRYMSLPNANAPLVSLELFSRTTVSVTIGAYTMIRFALRIFSSVLLSINVFALGGLLRAKMPTIIISAFLVYAPYILSTLGIESPLYMDITQLFTMTELYRLGAEMFRGGELWTLTIGYLLFLGESLLIVFLVKRHFCDKSGERIFTQKRRFRVNETEYP